jgi:DHA2 family multidrug resistance protein
MAVWGMGVMIGPILGPTLGGWLTDSYSWRWVFFINLPIGAVAFYGIWRYIHPTRAGAPRALRHVRLRHAVDRDRRAADAARPRRTERLVRVDGDLGRAGADAAVAAYFIGHTLTRPAGQSFVDFRLLKNSNYVTGLLLIFIVGMVLFATRALMPTMLQGLMGYPAALAGLVTAPSGLGTMAAMLVVGKLTGKVDFRLLLGAASPSPRSRCGR